MHFRLGNKITPKNLWGFLENSLTPQFHVDALRAQHEYAPLGTHSVGTSYKNEQQEQKRPSAVDSYSSCK